MLVSNEFDKMQIPYLRGTNMPSSCIRFVWRQPEFAFLCGGFGCRTFYFSVVKQNTNFDLSPYKIKTWDTHWACPVGFYIFLLTGLRRYAIISLAILPEGYHYGGGCSFFPEGGSFSPSEIIKEGVVPMIFIVHLVYRGNLRNAFCIYDVTYRVCGSVSEQKQVITKKDNRPATNIAVIF